jgi:hypothetical protein
LQLGAAVVAGEHLLLQLHLLEVEAVADFLIQTQYL